MLVTYIGHSTYSVLSEGVHILIDPLFSETFMDGMAESLPQREIDFSSLPDIDAIVITHFHPGHLEAETLATLPRSIPVFHPMDLNIEIVLETLGFESRESVNPGQRLKFKGTELWFTGMNAYVPALGFAISSSDGVFWYMGDRGDTLVLDAVREVVTALGGVDFLVCSHPSDFHSFLMHTRLYGGADEGEEYEVWLARCVEAVLAVNPAKFAATTSAFKYVADAEWLNRYMLPMSSLEFVDRVNRITGNTNGVDLSPGDVLSFAHRQVEINRQTAPFVASVSTNVRSGIDPTLPMKRVVDTNPTRIKEDELRSAVDRLLGSEFKDWLDSGTGLFARVVQRHRLENATYRITVQFPDDSTDIWRYRMSTQPVEIERYNEDVQFLCDEVHLRIAASTLIRWERSEIPYFRASLDCRRFGRIHQIVPHSDGLVSVRVLESKDLMTLFLTSGSPNRHHIWLTNNALAFQQEN